MIYWLVSVAALIAVWLNIRKKVLCFWIWSVTNATWVYVDFKHGIPSQAALQGVYFCLSIYGIYAWSKRRTKPPEGHNTPLCPGGPP